MVNNNTQISIKRRCNPYPTLYLSFFPKDKILDSPELKKNADDDFKVDENDRRLYKLVENTVRKREIARYEQFLFFPQCFQKACTSET